MRRAGGAIIIAGLLAVAVGAGVLIGNAYERYFARPWI